MCLLLPAPAPASALASRGRSPRPPPAAVREQRSCPRPRSTGTATAPPGIRGRAAAPRVLLGVPTDPSCHPRCPQPLCRARPSRPPAGESPGTGGSQPVAAEGLAEDALCPLSPLRDRRAALGKQQDRCPRGGEGRRRPAWAAGACAVPRAACLPPAPSQGGVPGHRQAQPGQLTAVGLGTRRPPAPGQDQAPDGRGDARGTSAGRGRWPGLTRSSASPPPALALGHRPSREGKSRGDARRGRGVPQTWGRAGGSPPARGWFLGRGRRGGAAARPREEQETPARSPRKPGTDGAPAPASGCTGAPGGPLAVPARGTARPLPQQFGAGARGGAGSPRPTPLPRERGPGGRRAGPGRHHGNSPHTGY